MKEALAGTLANFSCFHQFLFCPVLVYDDSAVPHPLMGGPVTWQRSPGLAGAVAGGGGWTWGAGVRGITTRVAFGQRWHDGRVWAASGWGPGGLSRRCNVIMALWGL